MSRIFIPFENFTDIGGPSTFMKNLKVFLDRAGFDYTQNIKKASGIFFPIKYDRKILKKFRKKRYPIIQRLDGIYYPEKHSGAYIELNRELADIYMYYADLVVFQSEYCKRQCFEIFGEKSPGNYVIIHNGVDSSAFYPPDRKRRINDFVNFVAVGNFRNPDMLLPIIHALDILSGNIKFRLRVIGPVELDKTSYDIERAFIEYIGTRSLTEIADILRVSDVFLYSFLNSPCPNVTLEAVSCGLPVVAFNEGATEELLFFNKDLLAPTNERVFKKYEDLRPELLAEKILLCLERYEKYSETALNYCHIYDMEKHFVKYLEVFHSVLSDRKN